MKTKLPFYTLVGVSALTPVLSTMKGSGVDVWPILGQMFQPLELLTISPLSARESRDNGENLSFFDQKQPFLASDLVFAMADLIKSETNLIKSRMNLIKSVMNLIKSVMNLIKSETNLIKSETNLTKSETNLIKSETDLTKSEMNLPRKVVKNRQLRIEYPKKIGLSDFDYLTFYRRTDRQNTMDASLKTKLENSRKMAVSGCERSANCSNLQRVAIPTRARKNPTPSCLTEVLRVGTTRGPLGGARELLFLGESVT